MALDIKRKRITGLDELGVKKDGIYCIFPFDAFDKHNICNPLSLFHPPFTATTQPGVMMTPGCRSKKQSGETKAPPASSFFVYDYTIECNKPCNTTPIHL